jgi:hypothetical protein
MFNCRDVNGVSYLVADMRLECYTGQWVAVATYAAVMAAVYVVGFPVTVLVILYRHRDHLFGDPKDHEVQRVQSKYGFLYRFVGCVSLVPALCFLPALCCEPSLLARLQRAGLGCRVAVCFIRRVPDRLIAHLVVVKICV